MTVKTLPVWRARAHLISISRVWSPTVECPTSALLLIVCVYRGGGSQGKPDSAVTDAQGAVPAAAEAALLFTSVPAAIHSRHQVASALLEYRAQPGIAQSSTVNFFCCLFLCCAHKLFFFVFCSLCACRMTPLGLAFDCGEYLRLDIANN